MARVGKKKKYGFVNTSGQLVIPIQYPTVNDFEKGFADVKIDGEWKKINKKGEIQ